VEGAEARAALGPYVPRLAAEWDLDHAGEAWQEIDATCCFVDISGFTALSERLARRGRIGAEELTEVLNHVFSRMLAIAYDKGGSLLKFGGDALLLAFTGEEHAVLAAQSAVAMRAALREARTLPTSVGRVNLRMSVGIHSGSFHFFRVGRSHRELIVAGPAATGTTLMEGTAEAGEIVVSDATAERLPAGATAARDGDGRLLRWRGVVEGGPGPTLARPVAAGAVEGSVPPALRDRLVDRTRESEHRLANIAFVQFRGVDDLLSSEGPAATSEAIAEVVGVVQEVADAESITFLASDINANGGKLILATGVPIAQDDDEGRLLRAGRAIVEHPFALSVRAGANRGHVFAGDIGTEFRRTFTVMGDTVNLAARLMAAAGSETLIATSAILDHSRTGFETRALEPFMVKGKSEPVHAFEVGAATGVKSRSDAALPFRGRDEELSGLRDLVRATHEGEGKVCVIEAERGAGKSRLVAELTASAPSVPVLALQGEPYGTAVPYLPLRDPLRRLVQIDADDKAEAGAQLVAWLRAEAAELIPLAPLLAPAVDAFLPDTPESSAVAEQFVRDRVAQLVVTILGRAQPGPVIVVAEDAHWYDDTSSAILDRVCAELRTQPWFLCATRRPGGAGFDPSSCDRRLSLAPIGDDAALALVDSSTATSPLRPHERDLIVARAGGNPLFLEELLRITERDDLEALPDTLDSLAMREIDALPNLARRVIRLASVLGTAFDLSLLREFLAEEQIEGVEVALDDLDAQLFPDGEERLRFRHALLREAAYQNLPFRTRLALHGRAGALIEKATDDLDDAAPVLSMHFSEARDWNRAWEYGRRAAAVAQRSHAPADAATHLDRAVAAARHLPEVDDGAVFPLLVELGETQLLLGDYELADEAFRHSAVASGEDARQRARIAERRAHLRRYQGRLSAAVRQVRTGLALLPGPGSSDSDAAAVRADLLAREAEVRNLQGRLAQSVRQCEIAIAEAERVRALPALALALGILDICYMQMGRLEEATHMGRTLELYEGLGDRVNVAATLTCLGALSYYEADWGGAVDYYGRSAEAATAAGDMAHAAIAQANLGEIRVNQGRLAEAEELLVPAQRTLESFGFREMSAWADMQLGRARAYQGSGEAGEAAIRAAAATFDDIDNLTSSVEARAVLAEVLVSAGALDAAAVAIADARDLERTLGETPFAVVLDRVEITLAVAAGERASAVARLGPSQDRARAMAAAYDLLVLLTLADRLGVGEGEAEATRLGRQLGVVTLPMLSEA
jgi:class 3 adenylate cyclase/tetratricopeptide (TPR) repeat protein